MMLGNRQVRRLEAELTAWEDREEQWQALIAERDAQIERLQDQTRDKLAAMAGRLQMTERLVESERLYRVSAQQGLANLYREIGRGHLIGYEPRTDPECRRYFATRLLRDVVREAIAGRGQDIKALIPMARVEQALETVA